MGFLKDSRHRLGMHTGPWIYTEDAACDQTRNCTGCDNTSARVEHTMTGWAFLDPPEANYCTKTNSCRRCGISESKQDHAAVSVYWEAVVSRPDIIAAVPGDYWKLDSPCAQITVCRRCPTVFGDKDSLHHQWRMPKLDEDRDVYVSTCHRCGEVKTQRRF